MLEERRSEDIPTHENPPLPAEKRTGMIATGFIIAAVLAAAVYWSA